MINNQSYLWIKEWWSMQKQDFHILSFKNDYMKIIWMLIIAYGIGIYLNLFIKCFNTDNLTKDFAGINFLWIQSFVDAFIVLSLYVMYKSKISLRFFLISFSIATIINYNKLLFIFYQLLIDTGLYPNFFKDEDPNVDGATLQYARVLLGLIILSYALCAFIIMKKNIIKVFYVFFITGFFLAMTAFHALVIIYPMKTSTQLILDEMKFVLENDIEPMKTCYQMEYHCILVKKNEQYSGAKIEENTINPLKHNVDLSIQLKSLNNVINDAIKQFRKEDIEEKYYRDDQIPTQVFRSVLFGMKKLKNNDIVVITDSKNASKTADFYLNWMAFNTIIAFIAWLLITLYGYDKHQKRNKNKELDILIN